MRVVVFFLLFIVMGFVADAQMYVGRAEDKAFFVDKVTRKAEIVSFTGIYTPYHVEGDTIYIDDQNFVETYFTANCMNFEVTANGMSGVINGKKVSDKEKFGPIVAERPAILFFAVDAACKAKRVDEK